MVKHVLPGEAAPVEAQRVEVVEDRFKAEDRAGRRVGGGDDTKLQVLGEKLGDAAKLRTAAGQHRIDLHYLVELPLGEAVEDPQDLRRHRLERRAQKLSDPLQPLVAGAVRLVAL